MRSLFCFRSQPSSHLQWLPLTAGAEQACLSTVSTHFHSGVLNIIWSFLDAPGSLFHWVSWLLPVLPRGCLWAPDTRERPPGSCSGPSPRPGAYAADLRGDESCGVPPPRRLPLPVTHRCWGEPRGSMMWLRFCFTCCNSYRNAWK